MNVLVREMQKQDLLPAVHEHFGKGDREIKLISSGSLTLWQGKYKNKTFFREFMNSLIREIQE